MESLRIGFASVYAWRPHVEHMMFLAGLVRQAGHEAVYLACDADLQSCYTRELRDVRPDWMECLFCRVGGVRSFASRDVSSIGDFPAGDYALESERALAFAASSASTLGRFEAAADFESESFRQLQARLAPTVSRAYVAARAWIAAERLDAVFVFNGRVDATRAIFEAARDAGIRALTFERSWFGDGLQLLPDENCLGLRSVHAMVAQWRDRPLTQAQAERAAAWVAARLNRTNLTEWRAYNTGAEPRSWPAHGPRKILLMPGSLNEIWGDANWASAWPTPLGAYDAVIERLGLAPGEMVLRAHPNWSEKVGASDGSKPEAYYSDWARARGVHVIPSADKTSTISLIAQADAVMLASGSGALEAAALGKQVISTAPSTYQGAGFRSDATSPDAVRALVLDADLDTAEAAALRRTRRRLALRYCYVMTHRLPQYVDHVQAIDSARFTYPPGADPQRLVDLVQTGTLAADDASHANGAAEEDQVLGRIEAGEWNAFTRQRNVPIDHGGHRIQRRWLLRPLDMIRARMPVGDR